MSFGQAIRTCFGKYVTFSGRASRPEYWYFFLFLFLGSIACSIVDSAVAGTEDGPVSALFGLATFLPMIAAGWRRMHDTGRSGLYLLYPIIAVIGTLSFAAFMGGLDTAGGVISGEIGGLVAIVIALAIFVCAISPLIVLFWLARPTQPQDNQWGPAPLARGATA